MPPLTFEFTDGGRIGQAQRGVKRLDFATPNIEER
jgi:hypothetical protein